MTRFSHPTPPRLQVRCKHAGPRPPACSQAGSRQKRELLDPLTIVVGGVDGTRAKRGASRAMPEDVAPATNDDVEGRERCATTDRVNRRRLRVGPNYIIFRPELCDTCMLAEPPVVATVNRTGRVEKWGRSRFASDLRQLVLGSTSRCLRTRNPYVAHPHIALKEDPSLQRSATGLKQCRSAATGCAAEKAFVHLAFISCAFAKSPTRPNVHVPAHSDVRFLPRLSPYNAASGLNRFKICFYATSPHRHP